VARLTGQLHDCERQLARCFAFRETGTGHGMFMLATQQSTGNKDAFLLPVSLAFPFRDALSSAGLDIWAWKVFTTT
jgi:hypothetical protein